MSADFVKFLCACCKTEKKVTSYHRLNFDSIKERDSLEKIYDLSEYWIQCVNNYVCFFIEKQIQITKEQCYGKVDGCYFGLFIVNTPYKAGDYLCKKCICKLEEEKNVTHIWTH